MIDKLSTVNMPTELLYDNMEYKRYKAMVDMPLLINVYEKILKIEIELYQLKIKISKYIENCSDDGK